MPSLQQRQLNVPLFAGASSLEMRCDVPTGDPGTELRVAAPGEELDLVGHLIQHC